MVPNTIGPDHGRYWNAATGDWALDASTFDAYVDTVSTCSLSATFVVARDSRSQESARSRLVAPGCRIVSRSGGRNDRGVVIATRMPMRPPTGLGEARDYEWTCQNSSATSNLRGLFRTHVPDAAVVGAGGGTRTPSIPC